MITSTIVILTALPAALYYLFRRYQAAQRREAVMDGLHAMSLSAAGEVAANDLIVALERHLEKALSASIQVVLVGEEPAEALRLLVDRCLAERRRVGNINSAEAAALCLPLACRERLIGVMIVTEFSQSFAGRTRERLRTLEAAAAHAAVCIAKAQMHDEQCERRLQVECDKLMSAIVSSLSHDLRTPLAAVLTNLESLRAGEHQAAALDEAVRQVKRADAFIGNLMTVAHLESGLLRPPPEPVLADDAVAGVLQELREYSGTREVRWEPADDLPLININTGLLHSLLLNVCSNVYRHAVGGRLMVIRAFREATGLCLAVEDDGPGIAAEDREAVFRKFARLARSDRHDQGLGLGLYICRTLLRAYGGDIKIETSIYGGACFKMFIPEHHLCEVPKLAVHDAEYE